MHPSRRSFLSGGIAAAIVTGAPSFAHAAAGTGSVDSSCSACDEILALFEPISGDKAIKIWAPGAKHAPEFLVEWKPDDMLFCASAFKAFALCEALRQMDTPDIRQRLQTQSLELNEAIWSPGSASFNPPDLSGKVSERTALEAMIIHSDNTGTDMILQHVGADRVRDFLAGAGLKQTHIPNSTRQFFGYLAAAPNWRTITWDEIEEILNRDRPLPNPPLNRVQTMASTPNDFVSFYSRALQGKFFSNAATLNEFLAILSRADAIRDVIPLGASAFLKGGSIDANPFHALSLAGGAYMSGRWVYFALLLNWHHDGDFDPATGGKFIAAAAQAFEILQKTL